MGSSPTDIGKLKAFVQGASRLVEASDDDEEKICSKGLSG